MSDAGAQSPQDRQFRREGGCKVKESKDKLEAISTYWNSCQLLSSLAIMCMP